MAIFSPSFLLGLVVLLYLSTFVIFAILRIATGISIQRIGYFSLRRIAYTPRDGIRIELRGLGLHFHRPTFAQPTWISLRLSELKVTVDVKALHASAKPEPFDSNGEAHDGRGGSSSSSNGSAATHHPENSSSDSTPPKPILRHASPGVSRSKTWKRLTDIKNKIKQLHENIHWLKLVDVVATNSSLVVVDVGHFEVGTLNMVVDTRRKTVDRGRLFQHKKVAGGDQWPAEWMITVKGVLFTPEGKDSLEVVDIMSLNIHGLLYRGLPGLRDASISLKLGRIHVPYDDLMDCRSKIEEQGRPFETQQHQQQPQTEEDISISDVIEELDRPGSRKANIVQTVSDSKEFVSSILRGIQEIQMAISFVGLTKKIHSIHPSGSPIWMNVSMNEFGIDMHRLDQKSPAHRMYFSSKDIAHQALLAAISIGLSLDDGQGNLERLLYIPMATTTIKTTLPSKTVAFSEDKNAAERNANMLFANLVVTSPSVDVDPKHMPIVLALMQNRQTYEATRSSASGQTHHLFSRLLPKANIQFSVHEPVMRVTLPPANPSLKETDEYDLLILAISSISLNAESSHSSAGELHYALTSNLRVSSNQLYYHSATGERHNLLVTEALEFKVQISASPQVCVVASGDLRTLSIHMIKPEISNGVCQIVNQLSKRDRRATKTQSGSAVSNPNFLRPLPNWLVELSLQGTNIAIEVAGVDRDVSPDTRGVAFQLKSWTADYKLQRDTPNQRPPSRRTATQKSSMPNEPSIVVSPPQGNLKDPHSTDGRRLAVHIRGLEGFVVEGIDKQEEDPFVSLPRFEVAFSTSSDNEGPIFHIHSFIKALYIQYSLYRYYAFGIASKVVQKAFAIDNERHSSAAPPPSSLPHDRKDREHLLSDQPPSSNTHQELVAVDVKAELLQVKARMPSDPPLMLHIFGVEAGRHRWAKPFLRSELLRLYAEAPKIRAAWARVVSLKGLRADLREVKKKHGTRIIEERSFDIAMDFIRIGVPHQLVVHKIFDNFVNAAKASEQLHHRFKTGTNDYILKKRPEGPKIVPRISIRSKALLFDIEDGMFDWKLGTIYRIGLIEQKQRRAREEAYHAKVRHLESLRQQRASSRFQKDPSLLEKRSRSQTAAVSKDHHRKGRDEGAGSDHNRHRSHSPPASSSSWARHMRYDPEGQPSLSQEAKLSNDDAWRKLQRYNAQSWKKRIDTIYRVQDRGMRAIRGIFWGNDEVPYDEDGEERILSLPARPGLMSTLISDLQVIIDKPSFPIHEYPKFLHSVGKGMPFDMEYSLLVPMNLQVNMGEARITLRDYPLPLLHVPAIRPGQSPRLPSWSLKTDFVIAEEYRGPISTKQVAVEVVPASKFSTSSPANGFAIDVRRTVSPVKTYSDVDISINTSASTKITWGTSYQPAIQDMMMVIEAFTKPQVDPSPRVGFWDKIRLVFHSRVLVSWKGDGDVHLQLKGSRDPYVVTSNGAGFVMVWRENVRFAINREGDPKKFMMVDSGEYALAIPDYSHQAREASNRVGSDRDSTSSSGSHNKTGVAVRKTIMKLSGDVRWLAGLVFERNLDDGGRSFTFLPHYNVTLTTPDRAKSSETHKYDAFRGFRSNYIHLSVAVAAPLHRDWTATNTKPSSSYNSVHLTPRFFTHFYDWWSLFSGVMSLPIRQGKLFPGIEKSSKKFGRHLATIKYNLLLSPLFMAHVYKHKDAADINADTTSATGLKLRLDSFMLDLHQRREEFDAQGRGKAKQMKASAIRINQAQLDFVSADIRAVSANIAGTTHQDLKKATDEDLLAWQQNANALELSRINVPDDDKSWVDADDFVELGWILPSESDPPTEILPLAFAPRFTYFRETDHGDSATATMGGAMSSAFGDEPTHFCVMSKDNDPRKVQCDLIEERICKMDEQIQSHQRTVNEQELHVVRDSHRDGSIKERWETLREQGARMEGKRNFLMGLADRLRQSIKDNKPWESVAGETAPHFFSDDSNPSDSDYEEEAQEGGNDPESVPGSKSISDFSNRFIVHNTQLKWNNSLRNVILRYAHQVGQRRGFVYYTSRRAVKFILDIVDEQNKNKDKRHQADRTDSSKSSYAESSSTSTPRFEGVESPDDVNVEDRIQELLNSARKFVDADDPQQSDEQQQQQKSDTGHAGKAMSKDFAALNTYHVRLIAPQIQLQSEKNPKSVLLVTAKSMQLKIVQIMDKERIADDVSGLVQRRFTVDMDSVQFFVTSHKSFLKVLHLYTGNRYGTSSGSAWPPWVPFEVNIDYKYDPFGWARVVQKTSASLRYDKYNTLRLKYNDEVMHGDNNKEQQHHQESHESRIDHLMVNFPQLRAICDSTQYYTMYVIVLDLLLYNEPLEKVRSEKLEKIMLASDFSDLRGAPEMVIGLQSRIRLLEEIKTHFQIHAKYLDKQGWEDHLAIEEDLASCEDELFFMMKAITTSQRKVDDRSQTAQTTGLLHWYLSASEIVWHLMNEKDDPLMEIQLNNAIYDRTDNSDGSNHNVMKIERMHGLNLLPNAIYPEMLGPYLESGRKFIDGEDPKMLKVNWHSLEAIAGIPVLDQFEVDLFPLKVQLEREIGQKIFEYIFPSVEKNGNSGGGAGGLSPFAGNKQTSLSPGMDSDRDSDAETISSTAATPELMVNGVNEDQHWGRSTSSEFRSRAIANSTDKDNHSISTPHKSKHSASSNHGGEHHHRFGFFHHSNDSSAAKSRIGSRKPSTESLTLSRPKNSNHNSSSNLSGLNMPPPSSTTITTPTASTSHRKTFLKRTNSSASTSHQHPTGPSDDLSQMLSRASNYMTLAHVKIPSVVLCLSYKGKGERNIEDVHNFVFRMPVLEYRNKTWSNLDLALRLKKDVIRALISHTGAIIGNKFSHHRPSKQKHPQQPGLKGLVNNSSLLSAVSGGGASNPSAWSETSSLRSGTLSPRITDADLSRASLTSDTASARSNLVRSQSFASSLMSAGDIPATIGEGDGEGGPAGGAAASGAAQGGDDNALRIMRDNITRRFTGELGKLRRESGSGANSVAGGKEEEGEDEESTRKKSVLLLGRKMLGSLH